MKKLFVIPFLFACGSVNPDLVGDCNVELTPDPVLLDFTISAADRWSTATGCSVSISESGIPIHAYTYVFVDKDEEIHDTNPKLDRREVCGATTFRNKVEVTGLFIGMKNSLCVSEITVAHEIGHIFGPIGHHATSGLMANRNDPDRSNIIDTSSLEWVCSKLECVQFNPED